MQRKDGTYDTMCGEIGTNPGSNVPGTVDVDVVSGSPDSDLHRFEKMLLCILDPATVHQRTGDVVMRSLPSRGWSAKPASEGSISSR